MGSVIQEPQIRGAELLSSWEGGSDIDAGSLLEILTRIQDLEGAARQEVVSLIEGGAKALQKKEVDGTTNLQLMWTCLKHAQSFGFPSLRIDDAQGMITKLEVPSFRWLLDLARAHGMIDGVMQGLRVPNLDEPRFASGLNEKMDEELGPKKANLMDPFFILCILPQGWNENKVHLEILQDLHALLSLDRDPSRKQQQTRLSETRDHLFRQVALELSPPISIEDLVDAEDRIQNVKTNYTDKSSLSPEEKAKAKKWINGLEPLRKKLLGSQVDEMQVPDFTQQSVSVHKKQIEELGNRVREIRQQWKNIYFSGIKFLQQTKEDTQGGNKVRFDCTGTLLVLHPLDLTKSPQSNFLFSSNLQEKALLPLEYEHARELCLTWDQVHEQAPSERAKWIMQQCFEFKKENL